MKDSKATKKTAVVLSGGGANGAYEVGVLKALCSGQSPATGYQPLEPDIFAGTSIGSFNCAFLVSQWDEYGPAAVANLETFWLDRLAGGWHDNGIFRIRANPLDLARPGYLLSNPVARVRDWLRDGWSLGQAGIERGFHLATAWQESLEQRLAEVVSLSAVISTEPMQAMLRDLDYRAIRHSQKRLEIAATNWATGELEIFRNPDMTESFGSLAVAASASIPGFFPPVEIGAQPFCDGSVLLNAPLSPAIKSGAEVLHVVYLDPDVRNIPLQQIRSTHATLMRMMQITWAKAYNGDIAAAVRINRVLASIRQMREEEKAQGRERELLRVAGEKFYQDLRPLTIHRYHPRDPLEGELGFLNFQRDRVAKLIERGFQDAANHDSEESGDVFPNAVETRTTPGPPPSADEDEPAPEAVAEP